MYQYQEPGELKRKKTKIKNKTGVCMYTAVVIFTEKIRSLFSSLLPHDYNKKKPNQQVKQHQTLDLTKLDLIILHLKSAKITESVSV